MNICIGTEIRYHLEIFLNTFVLIWKFDLHDSLKTADLFYIVPGDQKNYLIKQQQVRGVKLSKHIGLKLRVVV